MKHINMVMLTVNDLEKSLAFYEQLLEVKANVVSDDFAEFILDNGLHLGLHPRHLSVFANKPAGGCEFVSFIGTKKDVDNLYYKWNALNISIRRSPTQECFGYHFVIEDLDGHLFCIIAQED